MDSCICCGTPLGSNRTSEHVIPVWLQEALGERYDDLTRCVAESASEQVVGRRQHVFDSLRQGHVCGNCNNGWMAELEGQTALVLPALIDGARSPLDLSADESLLISRWAAKTALVLSSVTMDGSPRDLTGLRQLRDAPRRLPERWGIFAGVQPSGNRNFSCFDRQFWPSAPADKAQARDAELRAGAIKISLQLRHLLLTACYVPPFPFRFLLHAGLHIPLVVWPGEQILHTYRQQPLSVGPLSDPRDALRIYHDTLGIFHLD